MITLTNNYHGTEAIVRASVGDTLSAATVRRVRNKLCGMADCCCSQSELATRGPQVIEILPGTAGTVILAAVHN